MRKTIFVIIVLLLACSLGAVIQMNDIVPVFPIQGRGQIEGAVIKGAIHFLQAQSHAALLMMEYEKSASQPFNSETALEQAEKAVTQLEASLEEYARSIDFGKQAGYVSETVNKFKNFNYDEFSSSRKLNGDAMVTVKAYFSGGNILGAYQQNVDYISETLATLRQIKEKVAAGQLPDVSLFWQLTQQLSETALFGNYCTMTASEVFAQ
ncbi:MAG: hypothetical protein GY940_42975 [bacterium]|nr:hypothetical protein [bacterium]